MRRKKKKMKHLKGRVRFAMWERRGYRKVCFVVQLCGKGKKSYGSEVALRLRIYGNSNGLVWLFR